MTTNGRTDKTTYVYFQKASGDHSLRQGVKEHRKERDVLPVEDVQYISAQLNLLPMRRGIYCMRSLNKIPHGGALLSDKITNDCLVEKQKIENATIVHGGERGELDLTKDWGFSVWFPNHRSIRRIKYATVGEDAVLQYALQNKTKLVVDMKRNSVDSTKGLSRRIRWGTGQNQPEWNAKYRCYDLDAGTLHKAKDENDAGRRVNCPTINTDSFWSMPLRARRFLKEVAKLGKRMLDQYHGPKAMRDQERNRIFSHCLCKELGWWKTHAPFEYYDIQIMSCGIKLHRHMDYKNDSRDGYDQTVVYSFFRTLSNVEYKVSIVMTSRCHAGAFMERIALTMK